MFCISLSFFKSILSFLLRTTTRNPIPIVTMQASYANLLLTVVVLGLCSTTVQCFAPFAKTGKYPPPPSPDNKALTARYIVHRANWCTLSTFATNSAISGLILSEPTSVSDGTVANSTGIPYMYHATVSYVMKDIAIDNKVTLSYSEALFGIKDCLPGPNSDPEWPLCARVTMMGKAIILTDSKEIAAAQAALFSRHPGMPSWSQEHEFKFLKLDITNILIIDFFGGWASVPIDEYFKANP